jgi:hypothetical protein
MEMETQFATKDCTPADNRWLDSTLVNGLWSNSPRINGYVAGGSAVTTITDSVDYYQIPITHKHYLKYNDIDIFLVPSKATKPERDGARNIISINPIYYKLHDNKDMNATESAWIESKFNPETDLTKHAEKTLSDFDIANCQVAMIPTEDVGLTSTRVPPKAKIIYSNHFLDALLNEYVALAPATKEFMTQFNPATTKAEDLIGFVIRTCSRLVKYSRRFNWPIEEECFILASALVAQVHSMGKLEVVKRSVDRTDNYDYTGQLKISFQVMDHLLVPYERK